MIYKISFLGLTKKDPSLDGLDVNEVFELVECVRKGQIFILHALKVLISKSHKQRKGLYMVNRKIGWKL